MRISRLLTTLVLFWLSTAIYLPLMPRRPRCMMVYTVGDIESVKIFLNLPELTHQTQEEHYEFSMKNTENEDTKREIIRYGSFNKEYDLSPNVIYEVCVQLVTDRSLQNIIVYYKAQTTYNIEHSELKVPQNLLKKEDFKGAYEAAYHIQTTVTDYKSMQNERDVSSNEHFQQTNSVDKKLIIISVVQIVIIVAAGVYQYLSLQNYLVSKQYI